MLLAALGGLLWAYWPRPCRETEPGRTEIEKLIREGEFSGALDLAEKHLTLHPANSWLLKATGWLRFQVGDYRGGEERLKALAVRDARPAGVLLDLARLQEGASLVHPASQAASEALKNDPELPGARAFIARNLISVNRFEEARDLLSPRIQAGKSDPEELLAYGRAILKVGEPGEAVKVLEKALAAFPSGRPLGIGPGDLFEIFPSARCRWGESDPPRAEAMVSYGEALLAAKDFKRAADITAELLLEEPWYGRGYFILGTALARLEVRESALAFLKFFEEFGKQNFESRWSKLHEIERAGLRNRVFHEMASLYSETAQYRKAISACLRGEGLNPGDGPMVILLAGLLADIEAAGEAEDMLDRGIARGTAPKEGFLFYRGEIRRRAGRYEEAREWFDRALAANPNHLGSLIGRGRVVLESGRPPEEAVPYFERAGTGAPESWEPRWWLGRVLLEKGEAAAARPMLFEVKDRAEAKSAETLSWMGICAARGGEAEEGGRLLLEALKIDPLSPEASRGIEEAMRKLGDAERAARAKERRLEIEKIQARLHDLRSKSGPFETKGPLFFEIAGLCRKAGAQRETMRFLQFARAASPDSIDVYRIMSEVNQALPNSFFRLQALENIIRLNSKDAAAMKGLALLFVKLGFLKDRALELALKALEVDDSLDSRCTLGEVLLAAGDREGAVREAEAALRAKPGDIRALNLLFTAKGEKAAGPGNPDVTEEKK